VRSCDVISSHVTATSCGYSPVKLKRNQNLINTLSTATSRWLPVKWRHFRVTSDHERSRDVISCYVTATSCEFQPCKSSNVHKTRLIRLLQPLQGDFRSNDVTSGSLWVTWGHGTSFPVTSDTSCELQPCTSSNVPKTRYTPTATSRWLTVKWRHFRVASGDVRSRDVTSCHVTAKSFEFQPCRGSNVPKTTYTPSATSWWLPVKWHHFRVTSGHVRSCDIISCHVTATSCELQPCKSSNVRKTGLYAFYSHFQVTSSQMTSLLLTWGHVTSFFVTWKPPPASFSPVGAQTYPKLELYAFYSHFLVTSGKMTPLLVAWGHVTSFPITWRPPPASYSSEKNQTHPKLHFLQLLDGDFSSNDVTLKSLPVMWGHVTSFPVTWQPPPATFSPVGAQTYTKINIYAFYSHFQVTSGQMTSFPVTSGHVTSFPVREGHLLRVSAL